MTGIALATRVREMNPNLPIIIVTGYAELPRGEVGFLLLNKPFLQNDLELALTRYARV